MTAAQTYESSESVSPAITREKALRVLNTIDAGLSRGLGTPEPGAMCVEAAVCYALGLPHGADPGCVAESLRRLKIRLNDARWSSPQARARGLRRLGLAQLGSKGVLDERQFPERVARLVIGKYLPRALHTVASLHTDAAEGAALVATAEKCQQDPAWDACMHARECLCEVDPTNVTVGGALHKAYAGVHAATRSLSVPGPLTCHHAVEAAEAFAAIACIVSGDETGDQTLSEFAEDVVQILVELGSPGCQWLDLTETT